MSPAVLTQLLKCCRKYFVMRKPAYAVRTKTQSTVNMLHANKKDVDQSAQCSLICAMIDAQLSRLIWAGFLMIIQNGE